MKSLLNKSRPPVFCPGCTHEKVVKSLDKAFILLNLKGNDIVIVSDIGCSGLFDVFFNTHAMHGLHGRALTYATGIKMSNPEMNVVVIMGDGGIGIGGAHFLAACRRNLNLTLLVLNNFNFGMTGGQFSSTTPNDVKVNSGFLNQLEKPMDICDVAKSAGAPYVVRCSGYDEDLQDKISLSISYDGMSVIDIYSICPGRFNKMNYLTPKMISKKIDNLPKENGEITKNTRMEYQKHYDFIAKNEKSKKLYYSIATKYIPQHVGRKEVVILGRAGQRVLTAGEILCLSGMSAGLSVNQKNDYPITVLRGYSNSDIILTTEKIGFSGIRKPDIILALSQEGVERRKYIFKELCEDSVIIVSNKVEIPDNNAVVYRIDFKSKKIKFQDEAMGALLFLASMKLIITYEMLKEAILVRFNEKISMKYIEMIKKIKF